MRNRFDAWQIAAGRNARIEVLEPPHAAPLVPLAFSALETLATIERPEDAERLLRGTVRCETDVVFDLWTHRLAAVVEGAPSRVAQDGWLLEISAIRRGPQEVSILVRETAVVPLLRLAIPPGWHVALKKPGEAVMLAGNESSPHGTFWQALALAPLGHWTFYPASEEPARSRWRVFTFYRETGLPHTIDWIDRAQIAVVRTDYAGRVTRRLRVDRLTVREPPVPATP